MRDLDAGSWYKNKDSIIWLQCYKEYPTRTIKKNLYRNITFKKKPIYFFRCIYF